MRGIIEEFGKKPITEKELEATKNSIANSFIFSFTSTDQIALQQLMIEYNDLPEDYLITYRNKINNVTVNDVRNAAGEHLDPARAIVLIVGNDTVYKEVSSLFPAIKKIDRP